MRIRIKNAIISHKVTIDLEVSEEDWEQYQSGGDIDELVYSENSEFLNEDVDENECDYDLWTSDLKVDVEED